jgi:hypothetical protein
MALLLCDQLDHVHRELDLCVEQLHSQLDVAERTLEDLKAFQVEVREINELVDVELPALTLKLKAKGQENQQRYADMNKEAQELEAEIASLKSVSV